MTAAKTGIDGVINPQPVAAPLTRSAIFLVVTINLGPDHGWTLHRSVQTFRRCSAPWNSAIWRRVSPV